MSDYISLDRKAASHSSQPQPQPHKSRRTSSWRWYLASFILLGLFWMHIVRPARQSCKPDQHISSYGSFPRPDDPFHLLPCTEETLPPRIDDESPEKSWKALFTTNSSKWIWGEHQAEVNDRAIFMCGWIDVPFDYHNVSEKRKFRIAVTKYQVSGLARLDGSSHPSAGKKTERTIIIEPGGPGGSGTGSIYRAAASVTKRFSVSKFDVLGFDPRGVNATSPSVSCYPYDEARDRWFMSSRQLPEETSDPLRQLQYEDVINQAMMRSCWEQLGDLPRFVSTALGARDLDLIRDALGEDELTAYMVSYGTTFAQHYVSMFPHRVGRMILDGVTFARDDRVMNGFSRSALDNITAAWRDGFLGECVAAGGDRCALAKPINGEAVTLETLEARMEKLLDSLQKTPMPAYTKQSGPSIITYGLVIGTLFQTLYNPRLWKSMAATIAGLEQGNTTLLAEQFDSAWAFNPAHPVATKLPLSEELGSMVVCGDGFDATDLEGDSGLQWWEAQRREMHSMARIGGSLNIYFSLPCRHFSQYWPTVAEVYRGDFNKSLKNPVLLISETHDPTTPIVCGRNLLAEMGHDNARMVVHHGYGHSSKNDPSTCTDEIGRALIMEGKIIEDQEKHCFADTKPYDNDDGETKEAPQLWAEHLQDMQTVGRRLW